MNLNEAVVRRYIEEVVNSGRLEVLQETCAPNVVQLGAGGQPVAEGIDALRADLAALLNANVGVEIDVKGVRSEGDSVLVRSSVRSLVGKKEHRTANLSAFEVREGQIVLMRAPLRRPPPGVKAVDLFGPRPVGPTDGVRTATAKADYLGGDPWHPGGIPGGRLTYDFGTIMFSHVEMQNMQPKAVVDITIYPEQLRALSVVDAEGWEKTGRQLKRTAAGALVGLALGGELAGAALGALAGGATTKDSKRGLLLGVSTEDSDATVGFALAPDHLGSFAGAMQFHRRDLGLKPLPEVGAEPPLVADGDAIDVEPRQLTTGRDPIAQLKALAELRDAGVLTEAEFEAKKSELLGRI